ncbi:MAG: [LysW]-aminoadipate/[LysW]-glutamate kinase [Candidatus Bathyarchaeia archaeon]
MIVTKLGGSVLETGIPENFVKDLKNLLISDKIVLVHGGGKIVNEIAEKMGKEQKFIVSPEGFRSRYTDKETMEIFMMVMAGKINKEITSTLLKAGIKAVGLSGIDGSLIKAERKKKLIQIDERGRKRVIDGGYTGRITEVDANILKNLLNFNYTPVIAPIALSEEYEALNIDGDRAAAYIAAALEADLLILFTDVTGVMLNGKLISQLTLEEAEEILSKVGHGMITKIFAATEALKKGVKKVVISSGIIEEPISSALKGSGTTIMK